MRRKHFNIFLLIILIFCLTICICSCNQDKDVHGKGFSVIFLKNNDIELINDEYQFIEYGKDAEFNFKLRDSMAEGVGLFASEGEIKFKDGIYTLYVKNIRAPKSINVELKQLNHYNINIHNADGLYAINKPSYNNIDGNQVYDGDYVRLMVNDDSRDNFFCWSVNDTIDKGGTIISYYGDYNFLVNQNLDIYLNKIDNSKQYFQYDLNGGTVKDSSTTAYYTYAQAINHDRVNTSNGKDVTRENYTLVAWNTQKDGTGERIGLGSRATAHNHINKLYAMWSTWTDKASFEYEVVGDEIAIQKCTAKAKQVVIPSTIDNKVVTTIRANSFANDNMLEEVIFPNTMRIVEAKAFSDCPKLKTILMSDNIEEISDVSFNNIKISKLYVNAVRPPTNIQIYGYKILDAVDRTILSTKPNFVTVGGSSCAYGFDSQYLEELLGDEYTVTNFGWNATRPMAFLMGVAAYSLKSGDVFVHVGEPNHKQQYGTDVVFQPNLWGVAEGNYDIISWVDMQVMDKLFDSFNKYNDDRDELPNKTYDEVRKYDEWGDVSYFRANSDPLKAPKEPTIFINHKESFNSNGFKIMNTYYRNMLSRGILVYESFGTINKDLVKNTHKQLDEFERVLSDNIVVPLISKISTYMFEYKYMDNGNIHHLSTEGARIRTERLYKDISAEWNKEKNNG